MTLIKNKATVMMIIITIIFGFSFSDQTAAGSGSFRYVALGDSLTVGLEPQHFWDSEAVRFGFVDRVYEQALFYGKATMKNYGVNGLTSTGLKNLLVTMDSELEAERSDIQSSLRDPRIDDVLLEIETLKEDLENADLITITIGGNDFGVRTYLDIRDLEDQQLQDFLNEKLEVYQENIQETLTIIFDINPKATVVITDQYNPFPRINREMYQKLTILSTEFTEVLEDVVEQYAEKDLDVKLASVAKSFVNREILYTHILRGDIHPNQRGYDTIAKTISELLWGVYHDAPKEDKEITIIVKGEELEVPFPPVILNGTTFVPIREYAESLGAEVSWHGATQSAVVDLNSEVISFNVGSNFITVGNEEVKLNGKVQLMNGKVYVPLRAIAEGLHFDVTYIEATKRAFIN